MAAIPKLHWVQWAIRAGAHPGDAIRIELTTDRLTISANGQRLVDRPPTPEEFRPEVAEFTL